MTKGPSWPQRALRAIPVFFRRWNDIDVYIEDTRLHTQNIYCELVNKIGAGRFSVSKVFPLGNREAVIKACKADQRPGGRHRIYVIDGDLDLLTGERVPKLRRLYRHDAYCIENYLIDEDAAVEVLHDELADDDKTEARRKLDFSKWEREIECISELFVMFAVQRKLSPSAASVSTGFSKIVTDTKPPWLSEKKVNRLISETYTALCATHGVEVVVRELVTIYDRMTSYHAPSLVVSGKDYLLKLFRWYLGKQTKIVATAKSLELRLAKACSMGRHVGFRRAIESAASARF